MIVSSASLLVRMISADSRCSASSSVRSSSPLIPIIAFIGVRISWLIEARNTLFASARRVRLLARALELADVARLVDRRRGERGEGLRHVGVLVGVEVRLEGVERQHPDQAVADQQRNGHP